MKKIIILTFIFLLCAIGIGFLWFSYSISNLKTKTLHQTEPSVSIDYDKLKKIEELKQPGESLNLNGPNFGRDNPFLPY